jgi:predicted nucleotidyltransferase component of viral defense system
MPDSTRIRWHEDPAAFRDLLTLTAARTGFLARLVEKDYYCTVLLEYFAATCPGMVFKGGTCLAKVHAEFHRMSEDLDFTIPVPVTSARSMRSRLAEELKHAMAGVERRLPWLRMVSALRGANDSTQYVATVAYTALVGQQEETIKIEAGLHEPLLLPAIRGEARTLLLGPASDRPLVPSLALTCLSHDEAMAEKLRAALSRREPAIRDFYDVDHAIHRLGYRVDDPAFVVLVRRKLEIPGNPAIDLSATRLSALQSQLEHALKPVLRPADFASFDLERAFAAVAGVADSVAREPGSRP